MMPALSALTIATRTVLLCALAMPALAQEVQQAQQAQQAQEAGQLAAPAAAVTSGEVSVEVGQAGQRSGRASVARDQDRLSLDAAYDVQRNGNYRDGSVFLEHAASLGAEWKSRQGRFGFSVDDIEQETRYPAPASAFAYVLSAWPDDRYRYDVRRASAFVQRYLGSLELGVEASLREKQATATYVGEAGNDVSSYRSRQVQLAPRLRHYGKLGTVGTDTELGVDLMQWERKTARSTQDSDSDLTRRQHARALLLREELAFGGVHAPRVLLGLRREQFHLDPSDLPLGGSDWQRQRAWDLQGSLLLRPDISVYAKTARRYRIDDDGYTSAGYRPLAGQLRYEREVGMTWSDARNARGASLRLFSERLLTQIVFDQSVLELNQQGFAGNLEPARRDGVAIEGNLTLSPAWRIDGQLQQAHARYDDYPYDGADIALVPKTLLAARLYWTPPGKHSADVGVQWLRALRYGNDFDSSCLARTPAFATIDSHYAYKAGRWQLELSGSNLANRRHYGDAPACRSSIYQNDTRQLRLSARYRF